MNDKTIIFLALGLLGIPALASAGPKTYSYSSSKDKDDEHVSKKPSASAKPTAALRLARYWGKQHGLTATEIEEQATAIEESVARTRGPNHEGFDVTDKYAFKYKLLSVPKGSKRTAVIVRSNQPAPENLMELAAAAKKLGIEPNEVAIINLRAENNVEASYVRDFAGASDSDEKLAGKLRTMNIRILDHTIPRVDQVVDVLKVLSDPKIKIAVLHCKAGRARTGIMVALQRIVLDGWSVDSALMEAEERGLRRPLQKAFVRHFAEDWKAGKIKIDGLKS